MTRTSMYRILSPESVHQVSLRLVSRRKSSHAILATKIRFPINFSFQYFVGLPCKFKPLEYLRSRKQFSNRDFSSCSTSRSVSESSLTRRFSFRFQFSFNLRRICDTVKEDAIQRVPGNRSAKRFLRSLIYPPQTARG